MFFPDNICQLLLVGFRKSETTGYSYPTFGSQDCILTGTSLHYRGSTFRIVFKGLCYISATECSSKVTTVPRP